MKTYLITAMVLGSAICLSGNTVLADEHGSARGSSGVGAGRGSSGSHSTAGYGSRSSGYGARSSGYARQGMYPSSSSRIYASPYHSSIRNSTVHPASTHYPSVSGVNRSANVNQGHSLQQTSSLPSNQSQHLAKQAGTTTHQARDGRNLRQNAGVGSNQNQQLGKNTGTATKQAGNGRDRQLARQDSRHQQNRLDAQTSAKLRDYKGRKPGLAEARRFNHDGDRHHNGDHHDGHHHHNRDWWHNHCASIIWADWGWWGWYDGWWYPAWGYDSYYSYYAYDDPIYCYDGLPPDQIIVNVQSALQAQGYYNYAVDGVMGPLTRAALANYQRDHGLARTSAIDQPTLLALGFRT